MIASFSLPVVVAAGAVVLTFLALFAMPVRCAHPIGRVPFRGCRMRVGGLLGRCRHHGRRPGVRVIAVLGGEALVRRRVCDRCGGPKTFARLQENGKPFLGCSNYPVCKSPRMLAGYRL